MLSGFCNSQVPKVPAADPYAVKPEWFQECSLENMRVVGIDPGCRDFIRGVVKGDHKAKKKKERKKKMFGYSFLDTPCSSCQCIEPNPVCCICGQ